MSKKAANNLIVGLDIGTSKVVAIVGEVTVEGDIEIIGIGYASVARAQEGCGCEYRLHRAIDSARHRGSGVDGRLPDKFGVQRALPAATFAVLNSHGIVAIKDRKK